MSPFFTTPETELKDILEEDFEFLRRNPEILSLIHADQDEVAKEKKKRRLQDKRYMQEQTETVPGIELKKEEFKSQSLCLSLDAPVWSPKLFFFSSGDTGAQSASLKRSII